MENSRKPVRFTRVYHGLVAIVLLLGGGALLGLGVWLSVTDNGRLFDLEHPDTAAYNGLMSTNKIAFILGGFLLLTAVVSLIALSRACLGVTFRVVYIVMAIVIFLVLLGLTAVSILVLNNSDSSDFRTALRGSWAKTVQSNPDVICNIETTFSCRGFSDADCIQCSGSQTPDCPPQARAFCAPCDAAAASNVDVASRPGCYVHITSLLHNVFLPLAIVSGIFAGVLLLDIFFTCCL